MMLQGVSKIVTKISIQIENVPLSVYVVGIAFVLILLTVYGVVTKKTHIKAKSREICRRICQDVIIATGIVIIGIIVLSGTYPDEYHFICINPLQEYLNSDIAIITTAIGWLSFFLFVPVGVTVVWRAGKKKAGFYTCVAVSILGPVILEGMRYFLKNGMLDARIFLCGMAGTLLGGMIFGGCKAVFSKKSGIMYLARIAMVILIFVFIGVETVFATFHVIRVKGSSIKEENISTVELQMPSKQIDDTAAQMDDPDLIWHEGKAYRYNRNLDTVLVMGIDQQSEAIQEEDQVSGQSGQADAIFLVVLDEEKNTMSLINMSRDTMMEMAAYDYKGNYIGEAENHLGLAYAFGNGKDTSCQYMVNAVSKLFYGIPVNGYVALNMQAVEKINDAVGGVEVSVTEDLTEIFPSCPVGSKIRLNGTQAMQYIRSRDTKVLDSNSSRMERQKQYIISLINQAKVVVQQDPGLPSRMLQEMSEQIVTNIQFDHAVYLGMQSLGMSLNQGKIITLQGEAQQGSVYDEFYVNDDFLYELVLQVFYNEEKIGEKQ